MISLHYAVSDDHRIYGSEVLVSENVPHNAYGFQFGAVELSLLSDKGFYSRGVKAQTDSSDYELIRECDARGVPSVVIEHCHIDEEHDRSLCDSASEQQALGVTDATAAAGYFGLEAGSLGRNYSSFAANELIEADPSKVMFATIDNRDGIDELTIEQEGVDIYTGEVILAVHGYDRNDSIIYYDYTINGGETYSQLYKWPGAEPLTNDNDSDISVKVELGTGSTNPITLRAFNQFEDAISSNTVTIDWRRGTDTDGGAADIYDGETGQSINDDGRGSDTYAGGSAETGAAAAQDELIEEGEETGDEPAVSAGSLFVRNRQLTGLAIFVIVSPFVIGIALAGWYIYRKTRG